MLSEQYRTGKAYFMDFVLEVTPDTLIPRPETEILVEKALDITRASRPDRVWRILDVGTGSGNIAISLTKYIIHSKIIGLDISYKALLKAKENAAVNSAGDSLSFVQSDLFSALGQGELFDIIVSNPPYVAQYDMKNLPDEVKEEPVLALYGGEDGIDFYRKICPEAKKHLKKGGYLVMEIGYDQSGRVKDLLDDEGYDQIEIFKDYSSIDRIVKAKNG